MIYMGRIIEYTEDGNYRPDRIIVDGELYSMSAYAEEHGYNWRTDSNGNILYYRAASGKELIIPQAILYNTFRGDLYDAYKATGLSQRALAEAINVPKRTLEDWLAGRRVPSNIVKETVLEKTRALAK